MCAPELDFSLFLLSHFQTCPLLPRSAKPHVDIVPRVEILSTLCASAVKSCIDLCDLSVFAVKLRLHFTRPTHPALHRDNFAG